MECRSKAYYLAYITRPLRNQGTAVADALLNADAAGVPLVVAVEVGDGRFRIAPAVVALTVVEVDQPQTFCLEPEGLNFCGPARHDIAERLREKRMLRMVLDEATQLDGERLRATHRIGGQVLDLREERRGLGK